MDLRPIFKKKFPEGAVFGQCAAFAEQLVRPPTPNGLLGNSLMEKQNNVRNYGIRADLLNQAFRIGDIVVFNIGADGHVGVVSFIDWRDRLLYMAESNFNLDGRVHYGRAVSFSDVSICGVLRGGFRFLPPAVSYPLQIRVAVVFNNQQPWQSIIGEFAKVQDWFFKASGGRIQLIIDNPYPVTSLQNVPTRAAGNGMGLITEIVDPDWYDQNILPAAPGHDLYVLVLRPADFKGQVYNSSNLTEIGYGYEPHFPLKTFVVLDQNSDYAPFYADPDLQGLSKFICHEICHVLYGIALDYRFAPGSDFTHNHWFGLNGNPVDPGACLPDLNTDLIGWIIQ